MNPFIKTLLLCLLLAALPLQGMAAAMQVACGPMEHHGLHDLTMSAQPHHHDGDAMDMLDMSGIDPAGADAAMRSGMPPDKSVGATKHKHSACSACASCCAGALAPPSMPVLTPAHSPSLAIVASSAPLVVGFIPAGLERPPKRIAA
jgi:hypothetical protein